MYFTLSSRHGAHDEKGLGAAHDRFRQWCVGRLVRRVLLTRERSQEWPALLRDVVADGAAQHRILRLERVEDRARRGLTAHVDLDLAIDTRERAQMRRQHHANHGNVCTSTDT